MKFFGYDEKNYRVIKFIAVGGCSTIIDFIIYILLSMQIDITISKGVSMICASLFSYIANKKFTFSNKEKTNMIYLAKFYFVFAINFLINTGANRGVFILTESKILSFVLATICGMTVNYIGQRYLVFGRKNY